MKSWITLLILLMPLACAHQQGSSYYLGDFDQNNQAPGRAYWVDGYFIQRKMERRPEKPEHPYFHKICELDGGRVHLARRDYACSSRPWLTGPLGY